MWELNTKLFLGVIGRTQRRDGFVGNENISNNEVPRSSPPPRQKPAPSRVPVVQRSCHSPEAKKEQLQVRKATYRKAAFFVREDLVVRLLDGQLQPPQGPLPQWILPRAAPDAGTATALDTSVDSLKWLWPATAGV